MDQNSSPHRTRPRTDRKVVNTSLPPRCIEFLRAAGDGNLSAGIVRAADALELLQRARVELSSSSDPPAAA